MLEYATTVINTWTTAGQLSEKFNVSTPMTTNNDSTYKVIPFLKAINAESQNTYVISVYI